MERLADQTNYTPFQKSISLLLTVPGFLVLVAWMLIAPPSHRKGGFYEVYFDTAF